MALWHFTKIVADLPIGVSWQEGGETVSSFDDGLQFVPGEEGFSTDAADQKAASLGKGISAQYTGTPNIGERIAREQAETQANSVKIAANAAIDAMLNPVSPEDAKKRSINDMFDALLIDAPERSEDIEQLRAEALAEVEGE